MTKSQHSTRYSCRSDREEVAKKQPGTGEMTIKAEQRTSNIFCVKEMLYVSRNTSLYTQLDLLLFNIILQNLLNIEGSKWEWNTARVQLFRWQFDIERIFFGHWFSLIMNHFYPTRILMPRAIRLIRLFDSLKSTSEGFINAVLTRRRIYGIV